MFKSIDVHGFNKQEVKTYLDQVLKELPNGTRELTIIHGFHSGSIIKQYVRNSYSHARIERKMLSMNQGETTFVLKVKEKKRG